MTPLQQVQLCELLNACGAASTIPGVRWYTDPSAIGGGIQAIPGSAETVRTFRLTRADGFVKLWWREGVHWKTRRLGVWGEFTGRGWVKTLADAFVNGKIKLPEQQSSVTAEK
jgi:hypothetical protein